MTFRPTPRSLVKRLSFQVVALADAPNQSAQLRALFLAHCELKRAERFLGGAIRKSPKKK